MKPRPQKPDLTEARPNSYYQLGTRGPSWLEQIKAVDAGGCSTSEDGLGLQVVGEYLAGKSGGQRRRESQP